MWDYSDITTVLEECHKTLKAGISRNFEIYADYEISICIHADAITGRIYWLYYIL